MDVSFPLHRFEDSGPLTTDQAEAIRNLGDRPVRIKKGRTIRREGVAPKSLFFLLDGWAAALTYVKSGGRQVFKIHLPGDVLGAPSLSMASSVEELSALTDVLISEVPISKLGWLFVDQPAVAVRLFISAQAERVALMDRLSSIGRTPAESSVASFLLDLLERLEPLGLVKRDRFDMHVTQEQIADVLGLTSVHVNRMVRLLREKGLIDREGQQLLIRNRAGLAAIAARPERALSADLSWLPA